MKYKHLLTSLLLASALLLSACNTHNDPPSRDSTDTEAQTPVITDTEAPVTPAPVIPNTEEQQTEPSEETTVIEETVPTEETEIPIPELPESETEPVEDTVEPQPAETPAAPPVVAKPHIYVSEKLIPGYTPVMGQLTSAQSEHIRLLLDYALQLQEDGTVTLTLDVGLRCYELWSSAKTDMGTITVNGVSRTFSTDAIDHMVNERTYIPFLTQSYNATDSTSAAVEVSWNFNGTYGGMEIGTLSVGMTLHWDEALSASTAEPAEPTEPDIPTEPGDPVPESPAETEAVGDIPTEPVEPTDPPAEPTDPVNPTEPAVPPTEPTESSEPPAEPGEDTTPVPEIPPTEPEPDPEPTVTGTPEETVPTDET